jgi:hypothetical protein
MAAVIPLNGRVQVTAGTGTVRFVGQTAFAAGSHGTPLVKNADHTGAYKHAVPVRTREVARPCDGSVNLERTPRWTMAAVIPLNGRVQVTAGTGTVRFVGQTDRAQLRAGPAGRVARAILMRVKMCVPGKLASA